MSDFTMPKKHCPFCGYENIAAAYDNDEWLFGEWFFMCPRCSAQGPPRHTREDAIAAWNRRKHGLENVKTRKGETGMIDIGARIRELTEQDNEVTLKITHIKYSNEDIIEFSLPEYGRNETTRGMHAGREFATFLRQLDVPGLSVTWEEKNMRNPEPLPPTMARLALQQFVREGFLWAPLPGEYNAFRRVEGKDLVKRVSWGEKDVWSIKFPDGSGIEIRPQSAFETEPSYNKEGFVDNHNFTILHIDVEGEEK
jgi:Lar family restriction alleviation protein